MKRALGTLAMISATAFSPRAFAQDEPPAPAPDSASPPAAEPAPKPKEEIEVRVVGDRADSLQKTPGSGTVIGAKDLKRAAPRDTAEMLRRVPGVQVREEYSGGSRIDISIRGLESGRSRRVLMLEDGIPMALNPYSEPDMNYAPAIERYRAIEVVKGSGNILFGPQTLAGTINFVTLAPPDRPTAAIDVDAGNYGYARVLGNYGDTVGNARYIVQLLHRRGDGFRNQPFDSTDAIAKVIFPTGRDGELMVKLGFRRDEADSDDIGLTRAMYQTDPRRPTLAPSDHLVLYNYSVGLVHEQRFSENTKLKTLVYAYETPRIWRRQDYTRVPAPGDTYDRIVGDTTVPNGAIWFKRTNTILDRNYDVMGIEPRAEHRMKTGFVAHTIDFGGRVLRETSHYQQRAGTDPESFAGSNEYEEEHAGTAFAGYLQDRIAFRDDLLVTPGVRYEHAEVSRNVLRQNTSAGVVDLHQNGSSSIDGIVPGVGMIYGTKRANVFGGVHVGFAPPRITSAISPKGVPADVGADKSINYETGMRVAPTKWLRAEATGYLSNFSNQVIVNTTPGADTNLADAGATNIYGVESGLVLGIGKLAQVATIVDLGARYTYSRATFRHGPNAGNLLPYAPEHTMTSNLDIEHANGVGGQVAYSFVGPQFTDSVNTVDEDITGRVGQLSSRHLVDATVHYKHKPSGLTLRLTAKNLLDTTYIAARRPEGIFPGAYRQILVGVRWDWEGAPREAP